MIDLLRGRHRRAIAGLVALAGVIVVGTAAAANPGVDPQTVTATVNPGDSFSVAKVVHTPVIPPRPDIIFLADTTGSMGPAIANVQVRRRS